MSNFVFVNMIVLLQGDKMQDLQVKSCLFKRKSLRDWLIRLDRTLSIDRPSVLSPVNEERKPTGVS